MFQSILPYDLVNLIRNLNVDSNSLVWSLQCNNEGAVVTLKWESSRRNANIGGVNLVNTVPSPVRRKPPSTVRRDRERKVNFLENGRWGATTGEKNAARSPHQATEHEIKKKVSRTSFESATISVADMAIQTDTFSCHVQDSEIQTENTSNNSKNVQTTVSMNDHILNNVATQTEVSSELTQTGQTDISDMTATESKMLLESTEPQVKDFQNPPLADTVSESRDIFIRNATNEKVEKISREEFLSRNPNSHYSCLPRRHRIFKHAPTPEKLTFLETIVPIATVNPSFKRRYDFDIVEVKHRYNSFDNDSDMEYSVLYRNGRSATISEDKIPPRVLLEFLKNYPRNCYDEELDDTEPSCSESED